MMRYEELLNANTAGYVESQEERLFKMLMNRPGVASLNSSFMIKMTCKNCSISNPFYVNILYSFNSIA